MRSGTSRINRRRLIAACALAAALAIASWSFFAAGAALVVFRPLAQPDAIVILASHEWERLPAGAALAREHPSAAVLLTEPLVVTDSNCHRCAERTRWLIEYGLTPERIHTLPKRVDNTHDEALAARSYAEQHAIRRLAIVTSPYHTRRALATFRDAFNGLPTEVGIYPACSSSPAQPNTWWASPYDRAYVAYEWAANLQYRVKFGVPLSVPGRTDLPAGQCSCVLRFEGTSQT